VNDAEAEAQKDRVRALWDRWGDPLGLVLWSVRFAWDRTAAKDDDNPGGATVWRKHFQVSADWRYLDALVTAYLPNLEPLDDAMLEQSFLHECMHIFLNELRGAGFTKDFGAREERVATVLAKAFQGVRAAAVAEAADTPPLPSSASMP
jgi:hypothetical protein